MLKPLGDRVVLKVEEEKEQTVGGFVLAGASKEKPQTAKVIAVGEGRKHHGQLEALTVAVGDVVVFEQYSGTEVKDGDEIYLIVREKDILAVLV